MPRGVPKAGFRRTRKGGQLVEPSHIVAKEPEVPVESPETDEEIHKKLESRFRILDLMARGCTDQTIRSLIVSGPAGLGKSYTVEQTMRNWGEEDVDYTFIKGYIRPTGLFKLLYDYRQKGKVIVFDDADAVFGDETSLNMLKAVCDSTEQRKVSYLADYDMVSEADGESIPKTFEFEGTIIFITNYDFDAMIDKGHKLSPHFAALTSRSHYVDLAMKTKRDYLVRIRQVAQHGLFQNSDLTQDQEDDVLTFIEVNYERMRELSLRMALKLASLRSLGDDWEEIANVTCLRNQ